VKEYPNHRGQVTEPQNTTSFVARNKKRHRRPKLRCLFVLWRWRESNPRPNRRTNKYLHV